MEEEVKKKKIKYFITNPINTTIELVVKNKSLYFAPYSKTEVSHDIYQAINHKILKKSEI